MSRARIKPVMCYAWVVDDEIKVALMALRTVADVLHSAPAWSGGRWLKVEIRPVPRRRAKRKKKA